MSTRSIGTWPVTSIGRLAQVRRGASPRPIDDPRWFAPEGPGWIRIIDVTRSNGRLHSTEQCLSPAGVSRSVRVAPGQLIMSICATIGEPIVVDIDACIHDGFVLFSDHADTLDTRFLYHFLQFWKPRFHARGQTGTQANLNTDIVKATPIPEIPLRDQRRVAEILDAVDDAVCRTETVIAKLQKIKAGLLHDLLIGSINEDGQLGDPVGRPEHFKNSPLGRLPIDWSVKEADAICEEIVVGIVVRPTQYYTESGVPVLRSANVREEGIDSDGLVFMSAASNRLLSKSMLRTGNIVTVRTGYPGTTAVVTPEFDGCNCADLIISRPKPGVNPHYFAIWVNSDFGRGQVLRKQGGLAQQHFNIREMQRLLVALPSSGEQREISMRLQACAEHIQQEHRCLAKFRLLKAGLMDDLLTGTVPLTSLEAPK